eukprot:299889_1
MPGYENQNVTSQPKENIYLENRDIIGPDYQFNRYVKKEDGWNQLCRTKTAQYNPTFMVTVSLTCGFVHAWLFQHCVFQWVPSMTRLSRLPLFAIPTMTMWYMADKYLRLQYHPERQDKHTLHQLLHRCVNSARHEAYKQQVEGLIGERGDF